MAKEAEIPPEACPVDHKTRAAWLETAKSQRPAAAASNTSASPIPAGESCDSSTIDQTPPSSVPKPSRFSRFSLDTSRGVSTIPRATLEPTQRTSSPPSRSASSSAKDNSASSAARPANNEQETGADKSSGNWIYPSEQMFFNAMKRKNFDAREEDMRSIVPIHNAVNERAWAEIKEWERGRGGDACGGPRLVSFSGLSASPTPKARLNTLLGYKPPFDRHDWVVDRCGTRVEYVIDFYAGRDEGKAGKSLNFYLDVRPKLNTWEGWRMRVGKVVGL
ncbi:hypothetical protein B0A49_00457 [Cryomyces minteri]|uniref:Holocytochrome c-type synthase n=1 Tax=Cryomyces minteri TaxID=331657 RepID=A0A4U0Y0Q0_9PEZI|nr:hypothetical protein B0A49_00731 [Cryomyces minteri]TKA81700.1 hypothetical protein B0A49_00457 [Cryomyces minteri]